MISSQKRPSFVLAGFLLAVGLLLTPRISQAANFTVDCTDDVDDANTADATCDSGTACTPNHGTGTCTLRAAISQANFSVGVADTITLPAGTYQLTIVSTNEPNNVNGDLDVKDELAIVGDGADTTIIDGNGTVTNDRVFEVDPVGVGDAVALTLSGVTVQGGKAPSDGGGILLSASGFLDLVDSVVAGNEAGGNGGGIGQNSTGSTLVVDDSVIRDNLATGSGGGLYVISDGAVIKNARMLNNHAQNQGGGLFVGGGGAQIIDARVSENQADNGGGGIYNTSALNVIGTSPETCVISDNIAKNAGGGGGFLNGGPLSMTNCTISGNQALNNTSGGGILSFGVARIVGSIVTRNRATNGGGGLFAGDALFLENSQITDNIANSDNDATGLGGGGIYSDTDSSLTGTTVSGNTSNRFNGGGIFDDGMLIIDNSTIADNTTVSAPDGGGGVFLSLSALSTVIRNSTISGNRARGDDGSTDNSGGGLLIDISVTNIAISNTTIVGNEADGDGGGIYNQGGGLAVANLNNVTIALNTADANAGGLSGGDGGGLFNEATAVMTNTIIAGNTDGSVAAEAPDCFNSFTADDNELTVSSFNLIQNVSGCEILGETANVLHVDPQFDPAGLNDNGGPTRTLSLQAGSPAIDAGSDGSCEVFDERGIERPQDGNGDGTAHCDLGALELEPGAGATTGGTTGGATGGDTTGGTTGGSSDGGGCSLTFASSSSNSFGAGILSLLALASLLLFRKKFPKAEKWAGWVAIVLAVMAFSKAAEAATYTVSTDSCGTAPAIADGAPGSLRFILNDFVLADEDVVVIPESCTVVLTSSLGDTDGDEDLDIRKSITLQGSGPDSSVIDANGAVTGARALDVDSQPDPNNHGIGVVVQGLKITGGNPGGGDGGGILVNNSAIVRIANSDISFNTAFQGGGVGADCVDASSIVVENTSIHDNTAGNNGGGIYHCFGALTVQGGSVIDKNISANLGGGVAELEGALNLSNTTITDNQAGARGGGVYNGGTATITDCSAGGISGNTVTAGAGGGISSSNTLYLDNCLIDGNHANGAGGEGGGVFNTGLAHVVDSTVSNNDATMTGGGVRSNQTLLLDRSTVSGNTADSDSAGADGAGGGIYNANLASITNSSVDANTTNSGGGGGISSSNYLVLSSVAITGNTTKGTNGGGVLNGNIADISDVTVSGNASEANGGGIYNSNEMALVNATVTLNTAKTSGGGIYTSNILNLTNATVVGNTADSDANASGDGGGIINQNKMFFANSIVAGNTGPNLGPDCFNAFPNTVTLGGPNIIQDTADCHVTGLTVALSNEAPNLGALADNAGPSVGDSDNPAILQTLAPQSGSPALDTGDDGSCYLADERGVARPQGEACDLGAFELEVAAGTTGGTTTGGGTTGGDTTGGTTGGGDGGGGCSLIR